tara:strand:- start:12569 stop:13804 length:1236 start_codon:yes stop_codon:yes gene_type:complete
VKKIISTFLFGSVVSQLSALAVLPIVTRNYSVESVSFLAVFLTFFNLFSPVLALRYESFIVVDYHKARLYTSIARKVTILNSLLLSCLVFIYFYYYSTLGFYDVFLCSLLMFILFVCYGLFLVNKSFLLVNESYRGVSISQNLRVVIASISKVILIPVGFIGLLLSEVIGALLSSLVSNKLLSTQETKVNLESEIENKKELWPKNYSFYETIAILLNQAFMFLPTLYIGQQFSLQSAGQFWLAYKVISLPNTQIGTAVSDAYFRKLSLINTNERSALFSIVIKVMFVLMLLGSLYYGVFFFFGTYIFEFVFGGDWTLSGQIASVICFWRFSSFISAPLSRVIVVLGRQKIRLCYDFISIVAVCILMLYSYFLNLNITDFVFYLSITCSILYILLGFIIITLLRNGNENSHS